MSSRVSQVPARSAPKAVPAGNAASAAMTAMQPNHLEICAFIDVILLAVGHPWMASAYPKETTCTQSFGAMLTGFFAGRLLGYRQGMARLDLRGWHLWKALYCSEEPCSQPVVLP